MDALLDAFDRARSRPVQPLQFGAGGSVHYAHAPGKPDDKPDIALLLQGVQHVTMAVVPDTATRFVVHLPFRGYIRRLTIVGVPATARIQLRCAGMVVAEQDGSHEMALGKTATVLSDEACDLVVAACAHVRATFHAAALEDCLAMQYMDDVDLAIYGVDMRPFARDGGVTITVRGHGVLVTTARALLSTNLDLAAALAAPGVDVIRCPDLAPEAVVQVL